MPPRLMPPGCFTSVGSLSSSGAVILSILSFVAEGDIESHLLDNQAMLREIISYVESIEYDCELGLASGIRLLREAMKASPKVQELVELCKDRAVVVFILGHMLEITTRKIDPQYRNPWEMAMTTYLYAVTTSRPELTQPAIAAARRLQNGHWSFRYIQEYLQ